MEIKGGKKHDHILAKDATVLDLDGKECKLEDLKAGFSVKVSTQQDEKTVTKVEATSKDKTKLK